MVESATIGEIILEVEDLRTYFRTRFGTVKAVDGVSFNLRKGETLGIVGESGCGKSVTMLSMMRLVPIPPGRIVSGKVVLDGQDLLEITEEHCQRLRVPHPILTNRELQAIRDIGRFKWSQESDSPSAGWRTKTVDITWQRAEGAEGMRKALERVTAEFHFDVR